MRKLFLVVDQISTNLNIKKKQPNLYKEMFRSIHKAEQVSKAIVSLILT
jgi:hypothetical protein